VSIGASLRVWQNGSILPDNFFFDYTLLTLVMLIVGGRNSVTGAVLGVAVMTTGREIARRMGRDGYELFGIDFDWAWLDLIFRENLQTVFLGASMLGFMIWRPKGLLDDWELDEWLHRRFRSEDETTPDPLPEAGRVSTAVLSTDGVTVRFGGFTALDGAGLEARGGGRRHHRTERGGQDDARQCHHRHGRADRRGRCHRRQSGRRRPAV
jgi:hypothetical protein